MGAILFLLWSTPREVAGGGLLALLLFLLQRGLDLFADIYGDLQDLALAEETCPSGAAVKCLRI